MVQIKSILLLTSVPYVLKKSVFHLCGSVAKSAFCRSLKRVNGVGWHSRPTAPHGGFQGDKSGKSSGNAKSSRYRAGLAFAVMARISIINLRPISTKPFERVAIWNLEVWPAVAASVVWESRARWRSR
ncbi:MAG: hypothetical protein JWM11_429 [Planctomycetaceae bacterium]|nr:hypothetical protein [Planctomycetaceae bacterium]